MTTFVKTSAGEELGPHSFFRLTLEPTFAGSVLPGAFALGVGHGYDALASGRLVIATSPDPSGTADSVATVDVRSLTTHAHSTVSDLVAFAENEMNGVQVRSIEKLGEGSTGAKKAGKSTDAARARQANDDTTKTTQQDEGLLGLLKSLEHGAKVLVIVAVVVLVFVVITKGEALVRLGKRVLG